MENKAVFSILIANYNNGRFFYDCFQSLSMQTEINWEVVLVDDCSTDDSRFKIYQNEENKGVGFTKRKLVELSSANICGFLDPDDALENNAIDMMLTIHRENPTCGLVYSNFTFCDEFLQKKLVHQAKQISSLNDNYYNFRGEISHFATFKKSIYNQTSGIDSYLKIAEDKDWYMKMCEIAPVKHINESLYLYRVHEGGISTNKNTEKAFYWHFVALIKMAERRNINIENLFLEKFTIRSQGKSELQYEKNKIANLKNSRLLKLLYKIGVFKAYKYL